jgi:hypothetical protein
VRTPADLSAVPPTLRLSTPTAAAVFSNASKTILLYQVVGTELVQYVATAQVEWIGDWQERAVSCRLKNVALFPVPVTSFEDARKPGVRRTLTVEDDEFDAIVSKARSEAAHEDLGGPSPGDFGQRRLPQLSSLNLVYALVMDRWKYRCAVTGETYPPHEHPHPNLDLVEIKPRSRGGDVHVRNLLPMIPLAARSWQRGDISVGTDLEFMAVQNRLDPDLLERMRPEGTLLVPEDPLDGPDPANLLYHRRYVFGA